MEHQSESENEDFLDTPQKDEDGNKKQANASGAAAKGRAEAATPKGPSRATATGEIEGQRYNNNVRDCGKIVMGEMCWDYV
jgi:hypothetical protein